MVKQILFQLKNIDYNDYPECFPEEKPKPYGNKSDIRSKSQNTAQNRQINSEVVEV